MAETAAKPDAGRRDYTELDNFRQLDPGEPYFRVRGRDPHAADTARVWAALAYRDMAPLALVEQALQQADALEEWPQKRKPDAGHLTAEEAMQLAYQFERRAWRARADSADPRVMLAEERAIGVVMGRLRPVLTVLFAGLQRQEDGSYAFRMPVDELGKPKPWDDPFEQLRHLAAVLRQPEKEQA